MTSAMPTPFRFKDQVETRKKIAMKNSEMLIIEILRPSLNKPIPKMIWL